MRLRTDGEPVHPRDEIGPWENGLGLAEQGVCYRCTFVGSGCVVEEEAHADVVCAWERGHTCVCDELECHCRGVVGDAVEVWVYLREVGETEKGLEASICAELDVDFVSAFAGYGKIEGLNNLCGHCGARDGTDGIGSIVGKVELICVCECTDLKEGSVCDELRRRNGGVVDLSNVDEVEDYVHSVS